jgi:hypothetical protein
VSTDGGSNTVPSVDNFNDPGNGDNIQRPWDTICHWSRRRGGLATISYYFKTYVDKFRSRVLASWSCYDFVKFLTPAEKRELLQMKGEDQEIKEINKYSGAEEGVGGDGSGAGEGGDNNGSNVSIGGGNASS